MAQESPNRLAEWVLLVRRQAPVIKQQFADWLDACKQEPRLIWETAAIRYTTYLVTGMIVVQVVLSSVTAFQPPLPPSAKAAATTADFHVICTNSACATHFVIHRSFGFDDFPVQCPLCKQETGLAARQCLSSKCHGRWVVPIEKSGMKCSICGGNL